MTRTVHRGVRVALGCTRVVNPLSHDNMSVSADYDLDGWPDGLEEPVHTIARRTHEDDVWFIRILNRLDAGL